MKSSSFQFIYEVKSEVFDLFQDVKVENEETKAEVEDYE